EGALLPILTVLLGGGFIAALVSLYKARSDRDVSVSAAYSKLVEDLRKRIDELEQQLEKERELRRQEAALRRKENDAATSRIADLNARVAQLERQLAAAMSD